jgi:hypothetical protein
VVSGTKKIKYAVMRDPDQRKHRIRQKSARVESVSNIPPSGKSGSAQQSKSVRGVSSFGLIEGLIVFVRRDDSLSISPMMCVG